MLLLAKKNEKKNKILYLDSENKVSEIELFPRYLVDCRC